MIYFIIFFSIAGLISSNFIFITAALLLNLILSYLFKIDLKVFWRNLEKLSPFCIMLIISYFIIGILRNTENIIYIYLENAASIVMKIMIIILTNLLIKKRFLPSDNNFLQEYFLLFSQTEETLFEILNRYKGKIEKIKNIHNIIVEFIVTSINRSKHGNR